MKEIYKENSDNYLNSNNNNNKIILSKNYYNNVKNQNIKNNKNIIADNNIKSTFIKQNKPYQKENYSKKILNKKNKYINNQYKNELFEDSLSNFEFINCSKNISSDLSFHQNDQENNIQISINKDETKKMKTLRINTNNLNNDIYLYKNEYNYNNYNNFKNNKIKKYKTNNYSSLSNQKRNQNQKIKKIINNSQKNIYKNVFKNGVINTNKDICSTEIIQNKNYNINDNSCIKKYRTVKEMSKGQNVRNEDKLIFCLNKGDTLNNTGKPNLYKDNGKKFINDPKKDIDLFKEHLKIKKIKLKDNKLNNNIYNNCVFYKYGKNNNNNYKNKITNSEYRSIQQEKCNKPLNYSPVNSNTMFISSKNNLNNKNNRNIRENSLQNTNKRKRSWKYNNYNNNSYKNNISGNNNKLQSQMSSSSSTLRNSTINTGFKIKNVNINYFNIMQPNEFIFNQQRTNSIKQKSNISNISAKNNYPSHNSNQKSNSKNNNLKTNKYSGVNRSFNSLILMTDLIDIKKIKENMRKDKKEIITKIPDFYKHNDSCLSNDIRRPKMNLNELKKIRITKQSIRLIDKNSLEKNKIGNYNNNGGDFIKNFSNSNNKQISFIKIPHKKSNNNSKQKTLNNKEKIIESKNNNKSINKQINKKNEIQNRFNQTSINNTKNNSTLNENYKNYK